MKYKPSRDIPKACRELRTVSPTKIADWIRQHRTEKDKRSGRKVQRDIKPQTISMYFKRYPELLQKLTRELCLEELPKRAISDAIFENGNFYEIESIKRWTLKMRGRNASEKSIKSFAGYIRRVCQGIIRTGSKKRPPKIIEGWGLKHPDQLRTMDGLEYIAELKKSGFHTRNCRLALRNFLKANNREDWDDISGELEGAGKYAHLYITKEQIGMILAELRALNYEAYLSIVFAFNTACRIGATMTAHGKDFKQVRLPDGTLERTLIVSEKATLHKGKRLQEKIISEELYQLLKERLENREQLFNIEKNEINGLLRSVYERVIPELAKEIRMPFHFWRHQFAQHLLRETEWNYGLVARLGHWTVETLERYYGKMDRGIVMSQGRQYIGEMSKGIETNPMEIIVRA